MERPAAPKHIAIIMDGNRRWAEARGEAAARGHHRGGEVAEAIVEAAHKAGARWLTLFAFSTENWQRSPTEITGLMTIFRHFLINKLAALLDNNVRLRVIGNVAGFAPDIIERLEVAIARSAGNDGLNLTVALGYGGHADIAAAAKTIAQKVAGGQMQADDINADAVKSHLATAAMPPVDLLIRTGREHRVSNFMLWDIAYSELAFTDTLWPDFTAAEFNAIIADYGARERRFGRDGDGDGENDNAPTRESARGT